MKLWWGDVVFVLRKQLNEENFNFQFLNVIVVDFSFDTDVILSPIHTILVIEVCLRKNERLSQSGRQADRQRDRRQTHAVWLIDLWLLNFSLFFCLDWMVTVITVSLPCLVTQSKLFSYIYQNTSQSGRQLSQITVCRYVTYAIALRKMLKINMVNDHVANRVLYWCVLFKVYIIRCCESQWDFGSWPLHVLHTSTAAGL